MLYRRSLMAIACLTVLVGGDAFAAQSDHAMAGGGGAHRRRFDGPRPKLITLSELKRTCSFPVVTLPPSLFMVMAAETVTVPAGFFGPGSPASEVAAIEYSHTGLNGGVVRLFETAVPKRMAAAAAIRKVADSGIFKDMSHNPPWQFRTKVIHGVVIGAGAMVPAALDDTIRGAK